MTELLIQIDNNEDSCGKCVWRLNNYCVLFNNESREGDEHCKSCIEAEDRLLERIRCVRKYKEFIVV